MDELVERWLSENFQNKDTKIVYRSALNLYKQKILRGLSYRESLRRYKANKKRFFDNEGMCDIKRFMVSLQKRPSATKNVYVNVVKIFFAEHGLPIPDALWKRTKKRLMKGGSRTKDKAPNHKELKTITSHMDLKGRALTLFLASSGCRIGETLQLTVNDLDLEADPPRAHLRKEYTKYGEEGRLVFMNYEARDLIKDWLKIKHTVLKRDGRGDYGGKRVWNMSTHNARVIWNRAVEKARLQTRDVETGRRTLHLHSLRKFFRSYIKLPWDIVQGLMGHHAYLDKAYERIRESELAEMYREAIPSVSIYSAKPSRKEEIKRFVAMSGTNMKELIRTLNEMMYASGEGTGGGMSRKLPIDEEYILGLDDVEIGKLIRATLKRETLPNGGSPTQKIVKEDELEGYLAKGWRYVNSLNNGSGKCVITNN